jgi:adenosine deaminase
MLSVKFLVNARRCRTAIAFLIFLAGNGHAQTAEKKTAASTSVGVSGAPEQRAAHAYEAARTNPLMLRAFLQRMPKGADLHYHWSAYAETLIRDGAEDGLCFDLISHAFARPETPGSNPPVCGAGKAPVAATLRDRHLYDALVDAFSMRGFVPSSGITAHDHFFDTFDRFEGFISDRHAGEWLDEIVVRAASQNEQYLELMHTPDLSHLIQIATQSGWHDDLAQLRTELLAHGLRNDVAAASAAMDAADASRRKIEHCGEAGESPACQVTVRYLYQVLRDFPKEQVFAQTLLGFEAASADSRIVGVNYVRPEDETIPMADYELHMKMVGFLHGLYPKVHISLHAGELAEGLVPPDGLCCHIRLAVEQAGAERIGHGVDVMHEDRPYELLKEMASKHILVEVNLTSNDVILGVAGKDHPFPIYRQYHVPVSLSTDDEGVSRIDLTHEYVRAAETYSLSYPDLKQIVRTGIEHAFLPGLSLWREPDRFDRPATACALDTLGGPKPSTACASFLKSSEKAEQQWELERRFREFEAGF